MATSNRILVIASVLEGKSFPIRSNQKVLAEAVFDGEHLSTDPVAHTESPQFNQELAWEQDRKHVQQLKLQRAPIKLNLYSVDASGKGDSKQFIGYVILDVRTCPVNATPTPKWFQILHTKYQKSKPSIKIAVYIEDAQIANSQLQTFPIKKVGKNEVNVHNLKLLLNEKQGFYQLGPSASCKDFFNFSISLTSASNLNSLIAPSCPIKGKYFFFLNLLGVDISTESFPDLNPVEPTFDSPGASCKMVPEKLSIKLRTNQKILLKYLQERVKNVKIFLFDSDQPIAETDTPNFSDILSEFSENWFHDVELNLKSLASADAVSTTVIPKVKLTISIEELKSTSANIPSPRRSLPIDLEKTKEVKNVDTKDLTVCHFTIHALSLQGMHRSGLNQLPDGVQLRFQCDPMGLSQAVTTGSVFQKDLLDGNDEILPKIHIPKGKISLKLGVSGTALDDVLVHTCVLAEVIDNSSQEVLAYGQIPLLNLLHATPDPGKLSGSLLTKSFTVHEPIDLISASDNEMVLVKLAVKLNLERPLIEDRNEFILGSREASPARKSGKTDAAVSSTSLPQSPVKKEFGQRPATSLGNPAECGPRPEVLKTALDLEMWKEQETSAFERRLKEREAAHLRRIGAEWRARETARTNVIKSKTEELAKLETELKACLRRVEQRERSLVAAQTDIEMSRNALQRQFEAKISQVTDKEARLENEIRHRVSLEHERVVLLNEQVAKMKTELESASDRYLELETRYDALKRQVLHEQGPTNELHRQINTLLIEKVELERRFEACQKSRLHYKEQWGTALGHLATLREEVQRTERAALQRQQQEVEHLRLRFLASQETDIAQELRGTRQQLQEATQAMAASTENRHQKLSAQADWSDEIDTQHDENSPSKPASPQKKTLSAADEKITRLVSEKDCLLATGLYQTEDYIIQALDQEIRDAISKQAHGRVLTDKN